MEKPRVIEYSAHESITLLLHSRGPKFRTRYSNLTAGGLGTSEVCARALRIYPPPVESLLERGVYIALTHWSPTYYTCTTNMGRAMYTERRNLPDTTTVVRNNIIYIIQRRRTTRVSFLFRRPRRIYNIIYCARGPRDSGALPSFRG